MSKKVTTFNRPSIVDQVKDGKGSIPEIKGWLAKMEKDGASSKTLRALREAIAARVAVTPLKKGTFSN